MPLFIASKEAAFLKGIHTEVSHRIISTEVLIFKISQENTKTNIYGESVDRVYKPGIRTYATVSAQDRTSNSDNGFTDSTKAIIFSFIKADLKNQNTFLAEGDVIFYDNSYFQVDNVNDGKYWSERNPNTNIGMVQNNWELHGYDYIIVCETHITKRSKLNIEEVRTGDNSTVEYIPPSINKYL